MVRPSTDFSQSATAVLQIRTDIHTKLSKISLMDLIPTYNIKVLQEERKDKSKY